MVLSIHPRSFIHSSLNSYKFCSFLFNNITTTRINPNTNLYSLEHISIWKSISPNQNLQKNKKKTEFDLAHCKNSQMLFLFNFILLSFFVIFLLLLSDTNGIYVPKVYGSVKPEKCLFIAESGEEHQIYKVGAAFLFGRVFLLDEQNAKLINGQKCPEAEILKKTSQSGDIFFLEKKGGISKIALEIVEDEDGICRVKSGGGEHWHQLDYPIYSCQSSNSEEKSPQQNHQKMLHHCPPNHFFYLKEELDGKGGAKQQLIAIEMDDENLECGGGHIEPVGTSEIVETRGPFTLRWFGEKTKEIQVPDDNKVESEIFEMVDEEAVKNKKTDRKQKIGMHKKLLYKALKSIKNKVDCNISLKWGINAKQKQPSPIGKAAYQMKLICEDMKILVVEITKGNLENGTIGKEDLDEKLERTIGTLKMEYKRAQFGAREKKEEEEEKEMPDPTITDVFRHLWHFYKGRGKEMIHKKNGGSEKKLGSKEESELRAFAGTLLYLLSKIQRRDKLAVKTKHVLIALPIMVVVCIFIGVLIFCSVMYGWVVGLAILFGTAIFTFAFMPIGARIYEIATGADNPNPMMTPNAAQT